jgi:hypothetical protein
MEELLRQILEEIKGLRADLAGNREQAMKDIEESRKKGEEMISGILKIFPGMPIQPGKKD